MKSFLPLDLYRGPLLPLLVLSPRNPKDAQLVSSSSYPKHALTHQYPFQSLRMLQMLSDCVPYLPLMSLLDISLVESTTDRLRFVSFPMKSSLLLDPLLKPLLRLHLQYLPIWMGAEYFWSKTSPKYESNLRHLFRALRKLHS